jgi:hypothetical protein
LAFSGLAVYYPEWKSKFPKNGRPPQSYAYPLMAAGTIVLVVGLIICSAVIEESTVEKQWVAKDNSAQQVDIDNETDHSQLGLATNPTLQHATTSTNRSTTIDTGQTANQTQRNLSAICLGTIKRLFDLFLAAMPATGRGVANNTSAQGASAASDGNTARTGTGQIPLQTMPPIRPLGNHGHQGMAANTTPQNASAPSVRSTTRTKMESPLEFNLIWLQKRYKGALLCSKQSQGRKLTDQKPHS